MTVFKPFRLVFAVCATAALALAAGPAFAHAKLLSEVPAAEDASGATAAALDPNDGKVLVVSFKQALPKGEYTVSWTAVAADGHKTQGDYKLNVAQ